VDFSQIFPVAINQNFAISPMTEWVFHTRNVGSMDTFSSEEFIPVEGESKLKEIGVNSFLMQWNEQ
jgi:hypothetical protein